MPADGRAGCLSRWGGRPWGKEGGALPCAAGWGRRAQSISRWGRGPPRGRASAPVSSPTERSALWREKRGKQAREKWPRTLRHLQLSLWRWPGTPPPTACLLCPGGSCSNRGGALPRRPGRELSPPPWGGVWATGPGKGSPSVAQDTPRGGVACPWFRPRCCLSSRQTSRRASQYSARLRLGSGSRAVW